MKLNKKLVGLFVVFAVLLSAGLFVLSTRVIPVRISQTTTFIDSPLADDGLPNFAIAIVEKYRNGATNDDNGARLFWEAVGPGDLQPAEFHALCDELDVSVSPTIPHLVDVAGNQMLARLSEWFAEQEDGSEASNDSAAESILRAPLDGAGSFKNRPWTDEQFPPLAAWIAENQQPLDLLVAASKTPKFFSPPPHALVDPDAPVIWLLSSSAPPQQMRAAVLSLQREP